ncbi:MAG: tyrosine-type recombinase/integrase [Candidatus Altiarchaeota archaeon]|nr:tyrosine-type recombinase/integrase [Candidatus Altiarchaeota archaeon]
MILRKIDGEFQLGEDAVQIRRFLRLKELEGISASQRLKYYAALKVLLKTCPRGLVSATQDDLEEFLLLLRRGYRVSSQESCWYCVKKFLEFLGKGELFKELHPTFKEKGMKLPEELLTLDEINRLVSAACGPRDKALISVLYESGARIGEIVTLQLRHVSFDQYGAVLIVNGKTGMRRVRIVDSAPLLAEWIEKLHYKAPESPVWVNGQGSRVCYRTVHKMLKQLMKKCSVKKNIYPHLFRHTRATHLADKLTEHQLRVYFGWSGRSDVPSIYVHLSGRDVEEAILRLYGIDINQKPVFAKKVGAWS